uniref:Exostosin GT47 domain-containing protein n=1 Tax=Kalanchoe fedtschenkoi TaxID=63787 RepID=A0A7N0VLV8_KALFE
MEKRFKVWSYKEGEPPLFHDGPLNDIYSIEGQFISELEAPGCPFRAQTPDNALAYFLPVSIVNIIRFVYRPYTTYSRHMLQNIVADYIRVLAQKYPYWNRSGGADHFLVSCHDWAPEISTHRPEVYRDFIRVLCNANSTEGFNPSRDVSLPELYLHRGSLTRSHPGSPPQNRSILAFFAGGDHGHVRKLLFQHWKDKDEEIQVHGYLPKHLSYTNLMRQSMFCLCPSGYEVASPRLVESILSGCVPVVVSDSYVLPFSDVLAWSEFSVPVPVRRIPEIKRILKGISDEKYRKMQRNVLLVQRHFALHRPAKPFDIIHMIMHSIWLRRLNVKLPPVII